MSDDEQKQPETSSAQNDAETGEQATANAEQTNPNPDAATQSSATAGQQVSRQMFLRDAVVFHGKLMLDGVRDVVLFPVSVIAALIDFFRRDEPPGRRFYDVLHFARETERWINLFEAADRVPEGAHPRPNIGGPRLDEFIDDVEGKLREGYESGELSAKARATVEEMLSAAKRTMERATRRDD